MPGHPKSEKPKSTGKSEKARLEHELEETFPASDAVAVTEPAAQEPKDGVKE